MPYDFAKLEAARIARSGPDKPLTFKPDEPPKRKSFARTDYAVCKVADDGRILSVVRPKLDQLTAEVQAGSMRDAMTDADVARSLDEGWSFMAVTMGGSPKWKTGERKHVNGHRRLP